MASFRSLSEGAMEISLLQSGKICCPIFIFLSPREETLLISDQIMRGSAKCENLISGCNARRPWRRESPRRTECCAAKGDDGQKSEDALEATIQRSKKVKELLQQLNTN